MPGKIVTKIYISKTIKDNSSAKLKRTTMLITAITLHNIPEGMAVGLAFALAAENIGQMAQYSTAFALALGIRHSKLPGRRCCFSAP